MHTQFLKPLLALPGKMVLSSLLSIIMLIGSNALMAQNKAKDPNKKDKIEALRKKFFNEKLALTETEQKGFWPLYTEYKEKEKALRDSFRSKYKPNDVIFMDDKQAEEYLNATIKLNEDQNNLFKEYVAKFKKVIPVKKVAMLPMVEREFKKTILAKAREHRKPDPNSKPDSVKDEE